MINVTTFTEADVAQIMEILDPEGTTSLRLYQDTDSGEVSYARIVNGFFEPEPGTTSKMTWVEDFDLNESLFTFMLANNFYIIELSKRHGRESGEITVTAISLNFSRAHFYGRGIANLFDALRDLEELGTR